MKRLILGLVMATFAVGARADKLELTTGKPRDGRVTSFANMTFEFADANGTVTRHATAVVKRIDFESPSATIVTRTQGTLTGTLRRYENAAFILQTDAGKEQQVQAMLVKELTIAGGAGDDVDQVTSSDLTKHLPAGKVAIVNFYADWCGWCRKMAPFLEDLAKKDTDVVLRKVNVDRNRTLGAKYRVGGIPHTIIFDKTGREVATVVGANLDAVRQGVEKAKQN